MTTTQKRQLVIALMLLTLLGGLLALCGCKTVDKDDWEPRLGLASPPPLLPETLAFTTTAVPSDNFTIHFTTLPDSLTPAPPVLSTPYMSSVVDGKYQVDVFIHQPTGMICGRYMNPDTNVYSNIVYGNNPDANANIWLTSRTPNASITNWTVSPQ